MRVLFVSLLYYDSKQMKESFNSLKTGYYNVLLFLFFVNLLFHFFIIIVVWFFLWSALFFFLFFAYFFLHFSNSVLPCKFVLRKKVNKHDYLIFGYFHNFIAQNRKQLMEWIRQKSPFWRVNFAIMIQSNLIQQQNMLNW